MRRALLIAFHYPPIRHSSGIQRTLNFSRHLLDHGWQSIVLTPHPRVYESTGSDQLGDIPEEVVVQPAFALDATRHLSLGGKYFAFTASPDRYASWALGAVPMGKRLIRQYQPDVIWSTYPIATAHCIGARLQKWSGLPWVADCRDSMTDAVYPPTPKARATYQKIERNMVASADRVVFTTPGTRQMYAQRYPAVPEENWAVIPNGYDEAVFQSLKIETKPVDGRPLRLIHSGLLYPSERDPEHFFSALADLKQAGQLSARRVNITLRATGHDQHYRARLAAHDITDLVELAPPIAYREALSEMMASDGLLIFQSADCNHQIPAKLYEYFRAQRPILALTDPTSDTAATMREAGLDTIAPLDNAEAISASLLDFMTAIEQKQGQVANTSATERYARRQGASVLARMFDDVSGNSRTP